MKPTGLWRILREEGVYRVQREYIGIFGRVKWYYLMHHTLMGGEIWSHAREYKSKKEAQKDIVGIS